MLSDEARGGKGKVEKIRQSDILWAGHFYTVADFIDAGEGDIEDLFGSEIYAEIVNRGSYALPESHRVTVEKLDQDTSTTRAVKKVEAMFILMPDTIPMYDHYSPAAWLIRNPVRLTGESESIERTLSVVERVFELPSTVSWTSRGRTYARARISTVKLAFLKRLIRIAIRWVGAIAPPGNRAPRPVRLEVDLAVPGATTAAQGLRPPSAKRSSAWS